MALMVTWMEIIWKGLWLSKSSFQHWQATALQLEFNGTSCMVLLCCTALFFLSVCDVTWRRSVNKSSKRQFRWTSDVEYGISFNFKASCWRVSERSWLFNSIIMLSLELQKDGLAVGVEQNSLCIAVPGSFLKCMYCVCGYIYVLI